MNCLQLYMKKKENSFNNNKFAYNDEMDFWGKYFILAYKYRTE